MRFIVMQLFPAETPQRWGAGLLRQLVPHLDKPCNAFFLHGLLRSETRDLAVYARERL
jgi:hypothetical protein